MSKTAVTKRPILIPVWGGCDVLCILTFTLTVFAAECWWRSHCSVCIADCSKQTRRNSIQMLNIYVSVLTSDGAIKRCNMITKAKTRQQRIQPDMSFHVHNISTSKSWTRKRAIAQALQIKGRTTSRHFILACYQHFLGFLGFFVRKYCVFARLSKFRLAKTRVLMEL